MDLQIRYVSLYICKPLHSRICNASLYICDRLDLLFFDLLNPLPKTDRPETMKKPSPTLHDVAAKADVSTATVSRYFNFPDQLSARARKKVEKAVRTLGYAPNFGARAMAARRTNTIGAIVPTMGNAIFAQGLQAFQDELLHHGFTLLVASTSYDPLIEEQQIRSLVARGADALLLIGHDRKPDIYHFLDAQDVPVLISWAYEPDQPRPSVGFDNAGAMQQLAAKVIGMGHRQLALISAHMKGNDRAAARYAGVKAAMRDAGLDPAGMPVTQINYSFEDGAAAFGQMMRTDPRPTMVFCGNDVIAAGALRQARQMGLSVPQDVSIVGFDDIELAQVVFPPLTTVHVPHADMGRRAAKALVEAVTTGAPLSTECLEAQIVMRDTLGPPNPRRSLWL